MSSSPVPYSADERDIGFTENDADFDDAHQPRLSSEEPFPHFKQEPAEHSTRSAFQPTPQPAQHDTVSLTNRHSANRTPHAAARGAANPNLTTYISPFGRPTAVARSPAPSPLQTQHRQSFVHCPDALAPAELAPRSSLLQPSESSSASTTRHNGTVSAGCEPHSSQTAFSYTQPSPAVSFTDSNSNQRRRQTPTTEEDDDGILMTLCNKVNELKKQLAQKVRFPN